MRCLPPHLPMLCPRQNRVVPSAGGLCRAAPSAGFVWQPQTSIGARTPRPAVATGRRARACGGLRWRRARPGLATSGGLSATSAAAPGAQTGRTRRRAGQLGRPSRPASGVSDDCLAGVLCRDLTYDGDPASHRAHRAPVHPGVSRVDAPGRASARQCRRCSKNRRRRPAPR